MQNKTRKLEHKDEIAVEKLIITIYSEIRVNREIRLCVNNAENRDKNVNHRVLLYHNFIHFIFIYTI